MSLAGAAAQSCSFKVFRSAAAFCASTALLHLLMSEVTEDVSGMFESLVEQDRACRWA
jgi:hypothetical protein